MTRRCSEKKLFRGRTLTNGILGKKPNEVSWMLYIDEDDTRPPEVQYLEKLEIDEVTNRKDIKFTDRNFSCFSGRDKSNGFTETNNIVGNDHVPVRRQKYNCFYANAAARGNNVYTQNTLICLGNYEPDQRRSIDDLILR